MTLISPEDQGKEHLTPELKTHFENTGESLVEFDVLHHRYSSAAKHAAALYWLRELRKEAAYQTIAAEIAARTTLKWTKAAAVAAILGAVFALIAIFASLGRSP